MKKCYLIVFYIITTRLIHASSPHQPQLFTFSDADITQAEETAQTVARKQFVRNNPQIFAFKEVADNMMTELTKNFYQLWKHEKAHREKLEKRVSLLESKIESMASEKKHTRQTSEV